MPTKSPKILLFDIETAPTAAWVWQKWQTNAIATISEWYILSFAYKWLGERKITCHCLPDYPGYAKNPRDDKKLCRDLHRLFDEADIVVAHHGDAFDIRKVNARLAVNGFKPPSPFLSVDTKKVAKKYFKFDSNALNDLGQVFGLGQKLTHTGFSLWQNCMDGDGAPWRLMRRYNIQDVRLLEQFYLKIRPWAQNHPNAGCFVGEFVCPVCGSAEVIKQGIRHTRTRSYQRYQCQAVGCGAWSRETQYDKSFKKAHLT